MQFIFFIMTKNTCYSILFFACCLIGLALESCEANKKANIYVYDAKTKAKLDSVFVNIMAGKNGDYTKSGSTGYTDSNGYFETSFMIGCSFGCYDIYIKYSKSGYNTITTFNKVQDTIYLTPLN